MIERLWAGPDTLAGLSRMGRYPRVVRSALAVVSAIDRAVPFLAPRRMRLSQREKRLDALYRAGSTCFSMRRSRD